MTMTDGLELDDQASAAVAKSVHRVSLDDLRALVDKVEVFHPELSPHTTIAIVRVQNGFILIGTSTPADPANFNAELGLKFAQDDALRQLWRLEGYRLRQELFDAQESGAAMGFTETAID